MIAIQAEGVSYRYGRVEALRDVDLEVPEGSICALLGPNGAGKTTLLQILAGVRRPAEGKARVIGRDASHLRARDRREVAWVAEDQELPEFLTLEQLEAFLAPLYPDWDPSLARELRERFDLDPRRRLRSLSRGERMKAVLLSALAPRPRLLLMDEPFSGVDVSVRDDLVRGLLRSGGGEGWTILVSSHEVGELESLVDRVAFLKDGRLVLCETMESVRRRFLGVEVVSADGNPPPVTDPPPEWMGVERSGPRLSFLLDTQAGGDPAADLRRRFPEASRLEVRAATLREVFVALVRNNGSPGKERQGQRTEGGAGR